jgi:minichromosome maintenance protein 10
MEQAPETESERIEREIQALLAKKEALQHEERKRQIAEEARKVDLLVESSPVKKKDRKYRNEACAKVAAKTLKIITATVFQHVTNLVAPPKQPLFLSKSLIAGPSSQPKAGPSRSKPTPQLPRPSSQAHSNNSLSSALHRSRQGNLEDDSEGAERGGKKRTEVDLTVVENLTMGPKDYGLDATGLDGWKWVEPNSGVNLK